MKWAKGGLIYAPTGKRWWARTHAHLPTAEVLDNQCIRVYFAGLDDRQFGRIGYVDLDIDDPRKVLYESPEPVLDLGELGCFDDSGVTPSSVVRLHDREYLYYIGWQRAQRVPYMLFSGLAIGMKRGGVFVRQSRVPVLDRTSSEPFSRSAPMVLVQDEKWRMWFWSCTRWSQEGTRIQYNNVIKYAESTDGVAWTSSSRNCIVPEEHGDYSVGRPWVVKDSSLFRMWYSIRSTTRPYRIGYAESDNGLDWVRKDDEVGIAASPAGWDSEMICYPCVVDARGKRYMFYNGNRHGASGFGFAVLESD